MKYLIAALLVGAFFISPAEARHRRQVAPLQPCFFFCPYPDSVQNSLPTKRRVAPANRRNANVLVASPFVDHVVGYGHQQQFVQRMGEALKVARGAVVSHPAGCPHRAFCGCGAAVRVFGHPVRSLYLAANWYKFPRSSPAPGTVAVRHHHVFVLEQHLGGSVWQVYDANSGRHATRIHARSISGYTIVSPSRG